MWVRAAISVSLSELLVAPNLLPRLSGKRRAKAKNQYHPKKKRLKTGQRNGEIRW